MVNELRQLSAKTRLVALLIILGVGALPLTTLLDSTPDPTSSHRIQPAPPAAPNGSPTEDPLAGPTWTNHAGTPDLWPPTGDRPRPAFKTCLQSGHLRRIDRPPTA